MLVLTERKTREEIIEIVNSGKSEEVTHVIDRSKKQFGNNFYRIFKSITIDNGSEFRNVEMLEGALSDKDNQVELYYCSSVPIL